MTVGKVVLNFAVLHGVLDRTEIGIRVGTITYFDVMRNKIGQRIPHLVVHILMNVKPLGRIAKLRIILKRCPK